MTINSNAITSLAAPAYAPPQQQGAVIANKQTYSVSFSAQFDDEAKSLKFAAMLLNMTAGDNE